MNVLARDRARARAGELVSRTAQNDWMDECVPLLMSYGKDQIVAVAACMRMWRDDWEEAHPDGADDPGPSPREADPESPLADTKAFNEAEHPRDEHGRWTDGSGGDGGSGKKPGKVKLEKLDEFEKDKIKVDVDDPQRQETFLQAWNERIGMDPAEFKDAFLGQPGTMTILPEYHYAASSKYEPTLFKVFGKLHDEGGNIVGGYSRIINLRENKAVSSYLRIEKNVQGTGVGKHLLAGNVAMYEALGLTKVETDANIDNGGYAWARYGYVPKEESWFELRDELRGNMPSALEGDELIAMDELLDSNNPRTIWIIADSPWGKELLTGTAWEGVLDLTDKDTMRRFNSYVGRK